MKFTNKLHEGVLVSRYKRFFADVELKDEKLTIHVPNTGSLKSVIEKNPKKPQKCWFSLHNDPEKKLKGTLEAVQTSEGVWVGVNTSNPNRIVTEAIQEAIESKKVFLPQWKKYKFYKSEYKINAESRLDGAFLDAEKGKPLHFIEIKNTTYSVNKDLAQFPDGETERGQKHLVEMMNLMKLGHQCEVIYTIQRNDCSTFSPCADMDPKYAKLFDQAVNQGLIVSPLVVDINRNEIRLTNQVLKVV
jgi:sugar fermentation stimulation protein A